jgi:uncharacterized protein (DUF427 family)
MLLELLLFFHHLERYWHIKAEDERQHVKLWTYEALHSAFIIKQ